MRCHPDATAFERRAQMRCETDGVGGGSAYGLTTTPFATLSRRVRLQRHALGVVSAQNDRSHNLNSNMCWLLGLNSYVFM
jgi:hypothetical protein